jgi:hypothetical protein
MEPKEGNPASGTLPSNRSQSSIFLSSQNNYYLDFPGIAGILDSRIHLFVIGWNGKRDFSCNLTPQLTLLTPHTHQPTSEKKSFVV